VFTRRYFVGLVGVYSSIALLERGCFICDIWTYSDCCADFTPVPRGGQLTRDPILCRRPSTVSSRTSDLGYQFSTRASCASMMRDVVF
jgi:hypothetical protein